MHGEIITVGAATDRLALTLGAGSDGTLIQSGETISVLKTLSLGAANVGATTFTLTFSTIAGVGAEWLRTAVWPVHRDRSIQTVTLPHFS